MQRGRRGLPALSTHCVSDDGDVTETKNGNDGLRLAAPLLSGGVLMETL
jgi:hypothetical protein